MYGNRQKKWRTDYAILLKCWSMIKTSELLSNLANNQIASFKAEEKAKNKIKNLIKRNETKTPLNQTIDLWNQTIDEYLNQNNFLAAAECLESLSDIQLVYGSDDEKSKSLESLSRAYTYYKKGCDNKRAIIAIKKALTIVEFSPKRKINTIKKKYEECEQLYKGLGFHSLAKLNKSIATFFEEMIPYSQNSQKNSLSSDSTHCNHCCIKCCAQSSNSDSESLQIHYKYNKIYGKELVQKHTKEVWKTNSSSASSSSSPIDDESDYPNSDDNYEETSKPIRKYGSQKILRRNLKNILSKTLIHSEVSDNNCDEKRGTKRNHKLTIIKEERLSTDDSSNERPLQRDNSLAIVKKEKGLTTEITVAPIITPSDVLETKPKRKRRTKPKESSEECPEKRIAKLNRESIVHYFEVDPRSPLTRIVCKLCMDSILCYRWSTVTDHLDTLKHKHSKINRFNDYLLETTDLVEEQTNEISGKYGDNFTKCVEIGANNDYNYNLYLNQYINQQIESTDNNNNGSISFDLMSLMPSTSTQLNLSGELFSCDTALNFSQINDQSMDEMIRSLNTPQIDPNFDPNFDSLNQTMI